MINKVEPLIIVSIIFFLLTGCASILKIKPLSFYYNEVSKKTTYTTRDLYLVERNIPPYTLKLSVSKSCDGNLLDCDTDYYDLTFFSSS